jgi:hypothetical protein
MPSFPICAESGVSGRPKSDVHAEYLRLLRDCLAWIEQDVSATSFKDFVSSSAATRMTGHLAYSPKFEKMTLLDVLRCDRRTMFMLAFLAQSKRSVK